MTTSTSGSELSEGSEGTGPRPVLGSHLRIAAAVLAVSLWAAALANFGPDARGLISAFLCAVLVVLAACDLEQRRIPNAIVLPAIGVILVAQLAFFSGEALEWVAAGIGLALVLYVPTLFKAEAVGMGDVKLAALLGVGLGGEAVVAVFLGSLAAAPVALYLLITRGASARNDVIPLGPFLALGGVLALFLGDLPGA